MKIINLIVKNGFRIIVFFLLAAKITHGQTAENIIASAGNYKITDEEFSERFELMPHFTGDKNRPEEQKLNFLYSLIAEKLWAIAAEDKSLDTIEAVNYSLKNLEKLYLRDLLYKNEIESKIKISKQKINKGLNRVNKILEVNAIYSNDSAEIADVFKKLSTGADFDSLLKKRKEYKLQESPFKIRYGRIKDAESEDALFSLNPGFYSRPIKNSGGWFIFKLKDELIDTLKNQSSLHTRNIVYDIEKERAENKLSNRFVDSLLMGQRIEADGKLFDLLSEKIFSAVKKKKADANIKTGSEIYLNEYDLTGVLNQFEFRDLHSDFILFNSNPVPLIEFIYFLIPEGFRVSSKNTRVASYQLKKYVRRFIEFEILSREAVKRNLQYDESIINDVKQWRDNYLAHILMQNYRDSVLVTGNELRSYFSEKNKLPKEDMQINIIEVLTSSLQIAETVLDELDKGADIKSLAKKYTERKWTKATDGEFGFFSASSSGEIGRIAVQMKVGDIYGPLKLPEGYSIFKLIAKKRALDSINISFEKNKDRLYAELRLKKIDKILNERTIELANKYGVKIRNGAVLKFNISKTNTYTYRFIGFGGKITAMPLTIPLYNWYNSWISEEQAAP